MSAYTNMWSRISSAFFWQMFAFLRTPAFIQLLVKVNERKLLVLNELQLQLWRSIISVHREGRREKQHVLFNNCKIPKVFVNFHRKRYNNCCITPHLRTDVVLWETVDDLFQSWEVRSVFGKVAVWFQRP